MKLSIIILLLDRELVLNSHSMACHSKINTQETSTGGKGKFALFGDLETWEDGELTSKTICSVQAKLEGFEGEGTRNGGSYMEEKQVPRSCSCVDTSLNRLADISGSCF